MAPVIWGLDLAEIQWSKFKSSYMFKNRDYHLRRTKFVVYQCALIFCVVSESLGTAVLSDYIQMERKIQTITANKVKVFNNNYVGAGSYNIFAGVFVAFIFGAAFFFDLIWPERHESKSVLLAWKVCGVLATVFHLASALTLTVITARQRSRIVPHIPPFDEQFWWRKYTKHSEAPLIYRKNARAIAAVVFVWLGWVSVLGSCILLFLGIENTVNGPGPKSKHARERDAAAAAAGAGAVPSPDGHASDVEKEADSEDAEKARESLELRTRQQNTTTTTNHALVSNTPAAPTAEQMTSSL